MASYIEKFKSKLDWAMPFQRTGDFPLDRSSLFSSYADILEYAKKTGADTRGLGGTAYVGQIVVNYGIGSDGNTLETAAYLITAVGADAALMKLAQSSATGDLSADVAALQTALNSLADRVKALEDAGYDTLISDLQSGLANVYTKTETDTKISEAVANVDHLKRVTITNLNEIETVYNNSEDYIYMLPKTTAGEQNGYDEYMVINGAIEKVGAWDVDLSGYLTKTDASNTYATKTDLSGVQTTVSGHTASISTLETNLNTLQGTVDGLDIAGQITNEIGKLDVADTEVAGQYVNKVTQENGKIKVERAAFNFDTAGSANQALTDAKAYADSLAGNYDAEGSAGQALTDAKAYADGLAGNYATAAQGTKADNAVSSVTSGSANGTISVKVGEAAAADVAVKGLGDAAYKAATDFDTAGSADQALTDAKAYADGILVWNTLE